MKQIFKNYLATFVKHWLQTIGTILFILMMFAVVIGFLAAPLQIYSKITDMNRVNNKYDEKMWAGDIKFSPEFIQQFMLDGSEDKIKSSKSTQASFDQQITEDGQPVKDKTEHVVSETGIVGDQSVLSPIFLKAMKYDLSQNNQTDNLDNRSSMIRSAVSNFGTGAVGSNGAYFLLTMNDDEYTDAYEDNINNVVSTILFNSYQAQSIDITKIHDTDYIKNYINSIPGYAKSRVATFIYKLFSDNGFTLSPDDISSLVDNISDPTKIGSSVVELMRKDINKAGQKVIDNKNIYLLNMQVFNSVQTVASDKYANSMLAKLMQHDYSYSFQNYITRTAFMDENNIYSGAAQDFNFKLVMEKQMHYSKQDTSSLFPTKSVLLQNAGIESDFNQLQLEAGRMPTSVDSSLMNKSSTYASIKDKAEIVLSSNYAKQNNIKIGDTFVLPASKTNNNILPLGFSNSDSFLTSDIKFKVVGIGERFDDIVPGKGYTPYMEDISTYANAYVDDGFMNLLQEAEWFNDSDGSDGIVNAYMVKNVGNQAIPSISVLDHNWLDERSENGITTANPFKDYKDTKTMRSLNNTKIRVIVFLIIGAVVLVLAFIFINFTITKELNETRRQIGIFKSFGYKVTELSWVFATKTFLTVFLGAVLGYVVSIAIQVWSAQSYIASVMFSFDSIYANGVFLIVIFLVIPAVFLLISYFMTLYYLNEPTLSLLANGSKVKKQRKNHSLILKALEKHGRGFGYRLQQGFVKDSMGKFIVVQILFAFASLVFTLMFGAQDLMYSVADQGFAQFKESADHQYFWGNGVYLNVKEGQNKYELSGEARMGYSTYTNDERIGDVLDKPDANMSDSRFRENFLIGSIANSFDKENTKEKAMELLMPLDYYLVNYGNVTPEQLPDKVKEITNDYAPEMKEMLNDAAESDASITQLANSPIMYSDSILNWVLTFKMSLLPDTSDKTYLGMDKIIKQIKDDQYSFDFDALNNYVNTWDKDPKKKKKLRIKSSEITKDNIANLKEEFKETLLGIDASTTGENPKNNNMFLSDITKLVTLMLAQNYAQTEFTNELNKVTPANGEKYSDSQIVKALKDYRSNNASLWNDFSPNKMKYWGLRDNPLMDGIIPDGLKANKAAVAFKNDSNGLPNTAGLSLSKLSDQTIALVMAAEMLGFNSKDIQDMPVITINQAFINKDEEALFQRVNIKDTGNSSVDKSMIYLFDYKNEKFGKYETSLNHEGVSDKTYKELGDDVVSPKYADQVNAIIPYGLAKYKHLKVGDNYTVISQTDAKQPIHLRITGINKSIAMPMTGEWELDIDYSQFAKNYFSDTTIKEFKEKPVFNTWISNEPMLKGDINLKDIPGSINSMNYVGKNLAMQIKPGYSVFGSIFGSVIDISSLLGVKVDNGFKLITNPNIAGSSAQSNVYPYNILRAGVNNGMDEINNILIVFIVLVAIMLMIILVVVMNIIIEQATPIILTLKSLGYNQLEINWITMGSYIAGAAVSFVIAYCLSLIIWSSFLAIVGLVWHIYVFMHYTWKAPVVTFLVIGAILFIGWFTSDKKVEKIPLTLVTGFN